jgi:hypothetical protein|tara:strand:- start:379 stop:1851 length:1473 start_codon:yes stop_codon:yes gene_type:complete
MLKLTNTEYNFSYYNNLYSTKENDGVFDINQLIEVIKYNYLSEPIEKLRNVTSKEEKKKLKQGSLPAVTLSGIFDERNSKGLQAHSGLIQIDIDDVEEFDAVFDSLVKDYYTYVCFRSPSGNGIKAIVKINPSEETHLEQFYALEKYYKEEYNIEIDSACKDIARTMLLSSDPNLYCNPRSKVFEELYMPQVEVKPYKVPSTNSYSIVSEASNNEERCEEVIKTLESRSIDITEAYEDWVKIGFILSNEFGALGRSYFHRISSLSSKYNSVECDKTFTSLYKRNTGALKFASLLYYAQLAGVELTYQNSSCSTESEIIVEPLISDEELFELLRVKRKELANSESIKAYMVCKDEVLKAMVDVKPKIKEDFLNIKGFGAQKFEKYADEFLITLLGDKTKENPVVQVVELKQESKLDGLDVNHKLLYEELRDFRLSIANKEGLRAYHVFSNKVLNELVALKPKSKEDFLNIPGLGLKKFDWFGEELITLIKK